MKKQIIVLILHIMVVAIMLLSLVMFIRFIFDENNGWGVNITMPIIAIGGIINILFIFYHIKLGRKVKD